MKSKSIKMLAALILLIGVLGTYVGVKTYVSKLEENDIVEEVTTSVFTTSVDDIQSVKFSLEDEKFVFERKDDSWIKQGEEEFPLDQGILSEVLYSLSNITADRVLEDVNKLDEYGLDKNVNCITVVDGRETVINIGMKNESTEQYYVNLNNDLSKVYVVSADTIESFLKKLYDYAVLEEFPTIDSAEVTNIEVEKNDSYELSKDVNTELWSISDGKSFEKIDTSKYNSLSSSLGALSYHSMVDYDCEDESLYGLDDPYAIITVDYTEKIEESDEEKDEDAVETVVEEKKEEDIEGDSGENTGKASEVNVVDDMDILKKDVIEEISENSERKLVIYVGDLYEEENVRYVKIANEKTIYTIEQELLTEILDKKVSDFWSMSVHYLSVNQLTTLMVDYDGEENIINVSRETNTDEDGNESTTLSYDLNGKKIDDTIIFTTFYNKLINIIAENRMTEDFIPKDEAEVIFKFQDLENKEVIVSYYVYDTNYYAAVVDDKVYLVNKMDVKDVMDSYENLNNL